MKYKASSLNQVHLQLGTATQIDPFQAKEWEPPLNLYKIVV